MIAEGYPAAPVGQSNHEKGTAVDINWNGLTPQQQKSFVEYMAAKGYKQGLSFGEPWHFDAPPLVATATPEQMLGSNPVVTGAPPEDKKKTEEEISDEGSSSSE